MLHPATRRRPAPVGSCMLPLRDAVSATKQDEKGAVYIHSFFRLSRCATPYQRRNKTRKARSTSTRFFVTRVSASLYHLLFICFSSHDRTRNTRRRRSPALPALLLRRRGEVASTIRSTRRTFRLTTTKRETRTRSTSVRTSAETRHAATPGTCSFKPAQRIKKTFEYTGACARTSTQEHGAS